MRVIKNKNVVLVSAGIIFLIAASLALSFVLYFRQPEAIANFIGNKFSVVYRALDGMEGLENLRPIAIMIENHIDSRPDNGLDQASIVYEIITEGDITRFLAIFAGDFQAKKIGPVRSARPFFVELASEYNPIYLHSGGSPEALALLKDKKDDVFFDINEISADGIYFWRDSERKPPHNLYTSSNLVKRAIAAKETATSTAILSWQFKDDSPAENQDHTIVPVVFSNNSNYNPIYHYNADSNDYTRYINGQIDKTADGIFLKAKNIVVQHVIYKIIDDYGRLKVDLDSGGKAEIYIDGTEIDGTWKKENGRTYFYNQKDEEIKFNRGKIWVELVF